MVKNLKIVIPSDGVYAGYYYQAISATAPHPAAARLWEEYLYSTDGQNLFLRARPARSSCQRCRRGHRQQDRLRRAAAVPGSSDPAAADRGTADHGR